MNVFDKISPEELDGYDKYNLALEAEFETFEGDEQNSQRWHHWDDTIDYEEPLGGFVEGDYLKMTGRWVCDKGSCNATVRFVYVLRVVSETMELMWCADHHVKPWGDDWNKFTVEEYEISLVLNG